MRRIYVFPATNTLPRPENASLRSCAIWNCSLVFVVGDARSGALKLGIGVTAPKRVPVKNGRPTIRRRSDLVLHRSVVLTCAIRMIADVPMVLTPRTMHVNSVSTAAQFEVLRGGLGLFLSSHDYDYSNFEVGSLLVLVCKAHGLPNRVDGACKSENTARTLALKSIDFPFTDAGTKRMCSTASMAASSRPNPRP